MSDYMKAHSPDVGTDGGVVYQIRALIVKAIRHQNHLVRPRVAMLEKTGAEDIASLCVFPENRKEHVTQMPTSHS